MNKIIINTVLCLFVVSGVSYNSAMASESEFTSDEIKNIRFLSRSLLKSRANEKIRIENEVQPEKDRAKVMRDAVGDLESSYHRGMSVFSSEKRISKENKVVSITDDSGKDVGVKGNASMPGQANKVSAPLLVKTKEKILSRKRVSDMDRAISELSVEKNKAKENITSSLMFWKKRSSRDKRNEYLVKVASEVEVEIQEMRENGKLDIKKIKSLKEKLKIKKQKLVFEDIEPTFQTRTAHRK